MSRAVLIAFLQILFSWSLRDNLLYGKPDATEDVRCATAALCAAVAPQISRLPMCLMRALHPQEIQKAIVDSGAAEIVAKLPEGLETEMSATFSNLSVGQRQRLVIARAFLRNAPILLLDEPTSALDVRSEELVTEAIGRLRAGRTCIMITHRISTARDADFVVGEAALELTFACGECVMKFLLLCCDMNVP